MSKASVPPVFMTSIIPSVSGKPGHDELTFDWVWWIVAG